MCEHIAHLNLPIQGVMIEQGMLGENGAARSITPGNEVALYCMHEAGHVPQ